MMKEQMITFEKIQLVEEMIRQPVVYKITFYFKNFYKMIAIDSSEQQALDADLKVIQQINSTENLDQERNTTMFFIIEEAKETILDSLQGIVTVS